MLFKGKIPGEGAKAKQEEALKMQSVEELWTQYQNRIKI
jgi:hypothetical protein